MGHYALRIVFDDGHDTGLYSWAYLYALGAEYDTALAGLSRPPALQSGYARSPRIRSRLQPCPGIPRISATRPSTSMTRPRRVRGVFDSVAGNYDLMNDLMSGGLHRLWKRFTIDQAGVRKRSRGTRSRRGYRGPGPTGFRRPGGQRRARRAGGHQPRACSSEGRRRLVGQAGVGGNLSIAQVDAENLPFADAELRLRHDRVRSAQRHSTRTRHCESMHSGS